MSEEEKQIMNKMIYCNLVSGEQVIKFNNHIKEILQENEQLKNQLQQKESIIKEVREYCNNDSNFEIMTDFDTFENHNIIGKDILEILDKVD